MAFVVDASIAMGWLLQSQSDELTTAAESALQDQVGWIPSHFAMEVARGLRSQERRNLLSAQFVDEALTRLCALPLQQDAHDALAHIVEAVVLARSHALRLADATYLELALRLELPLATRDGRLAAAAESAGARLFRP